MLNKKGEETSFQYTIGLVLTVIILLGLSSCAYKVFNPNCDPASVEAFNEFVKYYEECASKDGDCGKFDYSNLYKLDNIVVEPNGEKLESTSINLKCNGKTSFRNSKKIDTKLCFKDGESIRLANSGDSVNIYSDEGNDLEYFLNNNLNLYNINQDNVCFVLIGKTMEEYTKEEARKQLMDKNYMSK